jgi:hypothetical protein
MIKRFGDDRDCAGIREPHHAWAAVWTDRWARVMGVIQTSVSPVPMNTVSPGIEDGPRQRLALASNLHLVRRGRADDSAAEPLILENRRKHSACIRDHRTKRTE